MTHRTTRVVLALTLAVCLGTASAGCRRTADEPEQPPGAVTTAVQPTSTAASTSTTDPSAPGQGSALTASDAAAIEKELSAIEKELGALSVPNDDFGTAEKALY